MPAKPRPSSATLIGSGTSAGLAISRSTCTCRLDETTLKEPSPAVVPMEKAREPFLFKVDSNDVVSGRLIYDRVAVKFLSSTNVLESSKNEKVSLPPLSLNSTFNQAALMVSLPLMKSKSH